MENWLPLHLLIKNVILWQNINKFIHFKNHSWKEKAVPIFKTDFTNQILWEWADSNYNDVVLQNYVRKICKTNSIIKNLF